MPFQSVPDCAEAVIFGSCDSKQIVNVVGFKFGGAYGQSDLDSLAQLVDSQVGSAYLAQCSSAVAYSNTLVRGLADINDLISTENANAGPGILSGTTLPNNVSLCITNRSARTGRSARGRFYAWPTVGASLASQNTFNSTYGDAIVSFLDVIRSSSLSLGWTMSVISRFTNKAVRTVGVAFPIVSVSYRNLIVDSQRGRLPQGH